MTEEISKFRITKILKKFDPKQFSDFEKFLNSPLHNHYKTLKRLFILLKPYYPLFKSKGLSRKVLFSKISSSRIYDHVLFNKYMSDLSRLAEEFIAYSEFKSLPEDKNILLLDYYRRVESDDLFKYTLNKIEKENSSNSETDNYNFIYKHRIDQIKADYYYREGKPELQFNSLIGSQNNLMNYFLGLSTYNFKCMYVHKNTYKNYIQKNPISQFWENFDFDNFLKNNYELKGAERDLMILNYYNVLLSMRENDFMIYRKMKKKLLSCYDILSKSAAYELFSSLNSYCIVKLSYGNLNLDRELFENFKLMLEEGLYERDNEKNINITEYQAIVKSALLVNEIDWCEYFINHYTGYVESDTREILYQYANCFLLFEKGQYKDALKCISKIKLLNHTMRADMYLLTLIIYYELEYFNLTKSLMDSFVHFLNENKYVSDRIVKGCLEFMFYYKWLLKIKKKRSQKDLDLMLNRINNSKEHCGNRRWLLRKIDSELQNFGSSERSHRRLRKKI